MIAVSICAQYMILTRIISNAKLMRSTSSHILLLKVAILAPLVIFSSLLVSILVESFLQGGYYTSILSAIVIGAYAMDSVIMGILTHRLAVWFRVRKSLVVILYASAAGAFTFNAIVSPILFQITLADKPLVFTSNSDVVFNLTCKPDSFMCWIISAQTYSMYAYFLLMWSGSIILLSTNIRRIGHAKFWILTSVPLIVFYLVYISAYNELYQIGSAISSNKTDLLMMTMIVGLTILCGILYGLGFLSIRRLIKNASKHVAESMAIAAYGIISYFIVANSTIVAAGYPPFGIVSIAFVPIAAILLYLGLHYSAVSVAHDARLRREVRSSIIRKTQLLDDMGTAEMQREMEKHVIKIFKEKSEIMENESGIPASLSEEDIKDFLSEVMSEMQKTRADSKDG